MTKRWAFIGKKLRGYQRGILERYLKETESDAVMGVDLATDKDLTLVTDRNGTPHLLRRTDEGTESIQLEAEDLATAPGGDLLKHYNEMDDIYKELRSKAKAMLHEQIHTPEEQRPPVDYEPVKKSRVLQHSVYDEPEYTLNLEHMRTPSDQEVIERVGGTVLATQQPMQFDQIKDLVGRDFQEFKDGFREVDPETMKPFGPMYAKTYETAATARETKMDEGLADIEEAFEADDAQVVDVAAEMIEQASAEQEIKIAEGFMAPAAKTITISGSPKILEDVRAKIEAGELDVANGMEVIYVDNSAQGDFDGDLTNEMMLQPLRDILKEGQEGVPRNREERRRLAKEERKNKKR